MTFPFDVSHTSSVAQQLGESICTHTHLIMHRRSVEEGVLLHEYTLAGV